MAYLDLVICLLVLKKVIFRKDMVWSPSSNYGSFANNRKGSNYVNGIDFLSGDYDIGFCGDLFVGGIALAATAFFYSIYTAITTGRKKRSTRKR